jgi:hypothetical protein
MRRNLACFAVLGCLSSSPAFAQAFARGTAVVYGNGMLNADGEWDLGMYKLKSLNIDRDLDVLGKVSYDVAINRSEWKDAAGNRLDGLEEFYQVARQKLGEIVATKYWLWLSRIEAFPPELQQNYRTISANVISEPVAGDTDLPVHIEKYRAYLRSGSRVLLVSHSQGNLYANQAWSSLFGGGRNQVLVESFGNNQVATPASLVSSSQVLRFGQQLGTWKTFPDDTVMANVRDFAGALPANLPFEGQIGDPGLGHNFVKAYMRTGSESLTRVVADMKNVARVLAYPTAFLDLSTQQSDTAALDDLTNDANNKDPESVEPGKSLYLEGSSLSSASFEVPGVAGRLSASVVAVPASHPLFAAGSEVYRLAIPATATVGASGKLRAIITGAGVEQVYESPRTVKIEGHISDWEIRRKGYALSGGQVVRIGDFNFSCPNVAGYVVAIGHVGVITETVSGVTREVVSGSPYGFKASSSFCHQVNETTDFGSPVTYRSSMESETVWKEEHRYFDPWYQADYYHWQTYRLDGNLRQTRRLDGQCDFVLTKKECGSGGSTFPDGTTSDSTVCNEPYVNYGPQQWIGECKARPTQVEYELLWSPAVYGHLFQPHYGRPVVVTPVLVN